MKPLIVALLAAAFAVYVHSPVFAANIFVPSDFATIQEALDAAADGDTVVVGDGTYTGPENKNLDFGGKSAIVRSENGPVLCIIDCEGDGRGFSLFGGGNPTVEGFTVINGYADWGGGVYCEGPSAPLVRNCRLIGNHSYQGGGVCANDSSAIVSGCEFSANVAFLHGGGLYSIGSDLTLENCTVSGNEALVGGGGALLVESTGAIRNNLIEGNTAGDGGGGISSNHSTITVANCTVSGNDTLGFCGGIDSHDSTFTITDCIVWGNTAWSVDQLSLTTASVVSILHSDLEGGAAGAFVEAGSTLEVGEGMIDADPLFVSGPLGAFYLSQPAAGQSETSPCVDAGSDLAVTLGFDGCTTRTDHQGDTGMVDMGRHYLCLNDILLFSPMAQALVSSPPRFIWNAEGETQNAYAVEMRFGSSPWYSTYTNLHLIIDETSWQMPAPIWRKIPSGATVFWRVRGIDVDKEPRSIVSSETRIFTKQ
jgi:hypothetical protein